LAQQKESKDLKGINEEIKGNIHEYSPPTRIQPGIIFTVLSIRIKI